MQLGLPIGRQQLKALHAVSKITAKQTKLSIANLKIKLQSDLKKLYGELQTEKQLVAILKRKLRLARSIMYDERKKYRQARSTLKNFIESIDEYDSYRYQLVLHKTNMSILTVEWLRLTDQLVAKIAK